MSHTVRTTFRPDLTVEVDDVEYRSLKRQGLLVEDTAPTVPAATAVPATTAKKLPGASGSKES